MNSNGKLASFYIACRGLSSKSIFKFLLFLKPVKPVLNFSRIQEFDKHTVRVYKNELLVGHVPIELSRLISYFLQGTETNEVKVQMPGKRKREIFCKGRLIKNMGKILDKNVRDIKE